MKRKIRNITLCVTALALFVPWRAVQAQGPERLPNRIDTHRKTIVRGSRNARVERLVSDGPVDDLMRISGLGLRFQPTYEQSAQLERLLREQQDPSSPLYHQWLTPEEYGRRFGLSEVDFAKVTDWITSEGFQVEVPAKSRTYISFSGTAAQVRETFGTELHQYTVDGEKHYANVRDAEIPAELDSLVYTIQGLDDFRADPQIKGQPRNSNNTDGRHAVTPGDLAVIYNVAPIYKAGITGVGQKIAVAGQAAFNTDDVRRFRAAAALPPSDPKIILMPGGGDPGYNDATTEALLDVEYAGGVAPDASIIYVYGQNAAYAAQYAVDQNIAPILSYSFVSCEAKNGADWWRNVVQQAVAQGITWVAASGDSGAAACESHNRDSAGVSGLAVSIPASVPEVTAVGGTSFVEGTGNYWAPATKDDGTSALSYIPEKGWNDTATGTFLTASGGGFSSFYTRPSWQTGQGMPNGNARVIPDIAFTASWNHDPYLTIVTGSVYETGGTSASTPFFAGVVALLNQYVVSNGGQAKPGLGNINPRLYQLAQTARGVFHDVTVGNNVVPCRQGTRDCTNGQYGFNTGAGYDPVTGLGSIDIAKLFENWAATKSGPKGTTTVVPSVEPTPVYKQATDADGYSWFYTVRLKETGGGGTAVTGFSIDGYDLSDYIEAWFGTANLPANGAISVDLRSKDLTVPSDHVFSFSGVDNGGQRWTKDITVPFLGETGGAAMSLTSTPSVVQKIGKGDPNCAADHPYHQVLNLKELNGADVNLTKFVAGGFDYTNNIATWFGSQKLAANATMNASLCWAINNPPVTLDYEIAGVDNGGRTVRATLQVKFDNLLDKKSGDALPREAGSVPVFSVQPALTSVPASAVPENASRKAASFGSPGRMVVSPMQHAPASARRN